jgi:hypothetical protein
MKPQNVNVNGQNDFEGEKFEFKSSKAKLRETTVKTTDCIAISTIFLFYAFIFLMDLHKFLIKTTLVVKKTKKIKK